MRNILTECEPEHTFAPTMVSKPDSIGPKSHFALKVAKAAPPCGVGEGTGLRRSYSIRAPGGTGQLAATGRSVRPVCLGRGGCGGRAGCAGSATEPRWLRHRSGLPERVDRRTGTPLVDN